MFSLTSIIAVFKNLKPTHLLIVIVLVLLSFLYIQYRTINNLSDKVAILNNNLDFHNNPILHDWDSATNSTVYNTLQANNDKAFKEIIKGYNKLYNKVSDIGIRTKTIESALQINMNFHGDTIINTIIDTVVENNDTITIERENFTIGKLNIIRTKHIDVDSSEYDITYNPTLFVIVNSTKIGKWALINIFKRRDIKYVVTISTDDNLFKPTKVTYIKSNKLNK